MRKITNQKMTFTKVLFTRFIKIVFLIPAAVILCAPTSAQNISIQYPEKSIRIIVPFAPGGTVDTVARMLAPKLTERLGQSVIVENRPGGGTIIGTDLVAKAPSNGYTLLLAVSTFTSNPGLYPSLPYDSLKDFAPISLVALMPIVPFANPKFPPRNAKELVAYSKKYPDSVNYGSGGTGTMSHMTAELLKEITGSNTTHVPYKGGALSMNDALAGHIPLTWGTLAQGVAQHKSQTLHALGVSSEKRHPMIPDVPTFRELGIDLVTTEWYGLMAPAGTPPPIIDRLNREIRQILADPNFGTGQPAFEFKSSTPQAFGEFVRVEMDRWVTLIRKLGIKAN